jgi:hypothetical protein
VVNGSSTQLKVISVTATQARMISDQSSAAGLLQTFGIWRKKKLFFAEASTASCIHPDDTKGVGRERARPAQRPAKLGPRFNPRLVSEVGTSLLGSAATRLSGLDAPSLVQLFDNAWADGSWRPGSRTQTYRRTDAISQPSYSKSSCSPGRASLSP